PVTADDPSVLAGRRVIAIEDGPTLTHGGATVGAAVIAARAAGAELVDPRPFLVGELVDAFRRYPDLGPLLPAMGYGEAQIHDLGATLRRASEGGVEAIAIGTPIDLAGLIEIPLPHTRVRYELEVLGDPGLEAALRPILETAVP
ncbi:MAG TPA: hypothetical protein VLA09_02315, partial [Longimicrobiales bacterium]|nr:hypothetical protein [Longimicrobiales bacterium]